MRWLWIRGPACLRGADRERGFTLIEALVALVIVSSVAVASLESFGAGLRAQRSADRHLEAVSLADMRLEEIAALPADSLRRRGAAEEGRFDPPLQDYRWRSTVGRVLGSRTLWNARVVVSWNGGEEMLETILYHSTGPFDDYLELSTDTF